MPKIMFVLFSLPPPLFSSSFEEVLTRVSSFPSVCSTLPRRRRRRRVVPGGVDPNANPDVVVGEDSAEANIRAVEMADAAEAASSAAVDRMEAMLGEDQARGNATTV